MYRTFLSILFVIVVSAVLSAQTSTDAKTTKTAHSKSGTGRLGTLTGCLSGPNDEGAYLLKNSAGHSIEVGGSDDLKAHVGHEVKLSGSWAKSGGEIGEREENEAAEHHEKHATAEAGEAGEHHERREGRERHFKVNNVTMVSDKCTSVATK
jgi:hypothetical protein